MTPATTLSVYRADPSNRNFREVEKIYRPWIFKTGVATIRDFPALRPSNDLEDVAQEGLLALSRSARRFVFFCRDCGEVFLHRADLERHAASEHGIRGVSELVPIDSFCRCGARVAMKRAAQRLLRPEVPEESPDLGSDDWSEDRALLELLVREAQTVLTGNARRVLARVLLEGAPDVRSGYRERRTRVGLAEIAAVLGSFGLVRE